jgi:hypothetical protein
MSNNVTNYGVQAITFDYRQEARGKGFNRAFCDVLPYGLYSGGRLTRISDTVINIGLLVCVIKSDEDDKVALRVETMEAQDVSLAVYIGSKYADADKPYIVLRFGWHDTEANYMAMRAVGWSANPSEADPDKLHPLDIILGKVLFQETPAGSGKFVIAPADSFDLSRRQDVFIKETEAVSGQFHVAPSEIDPRKVFISGGKVNTSKGRFLLAGAEFPFAGIPDTAAMGRTDLIVVNADGEFQFVRGVPSALSPAPAPKYQTYKVLAEIRRGPNRTNVLGTDIVQVADATIRGSAAAEDFPVSDAEEFLPVNAKNIEAAFNYLFHHSIAISPQDLETLGAVLRRNVNWSVSDPDGVYAGSMPVKDSSGLFVSENVEAVLAEIAGAGRTVETLKGLADAISALAVEVAENESDLAKLTENYTAHKNNKNNPHEVTKKQVGLENVLNVDATNASNLSSGTLSAARLPAHTGDVTSGEGSAALSIASGKVTTTKIADEAVTNVKIASGVNAGKITAGILPAARLPAHTGDVTSGEGSAALTLSAATVLAKLKDVDGAGSGLDADLLDGKDGSTYVSTSGNQTIAGAKTFSTPPSGVSNLGKYNDGVSAANIFANPPLDKMGAISYHHFEDSENDPFPASYKTPLQSGGPKSWDVITLNLSSNRARQIAVQNFKSNQNRMFIRARHEDNATYSTWQEWREITKMGDSPTFERLNLTPPAGSFVEGMRVKLSSGGWAGVFLGTDGSDNGRVDGQWNILRDNHGDLIIVHNSDGSDNMGLRLKKDGSSPLWNGSRIASNVDYAGSAGNADTVDGTHAYQLQTVSKSGAAYGTNHIFRIVYDHFDDGRFAFVHSESTSDATINHKIEVDYARDADTLDGKHGSDYMARGVIPATYLGGAPSFSGVTLTGAMYPTSTPLSKSHVLKNGDTYTPERGWYNFLGGASSGPYSGTTKISLNMGTVLSSVTLDYLKY